MNFVRDSMWSVNTAFTNSLVPAEIGVVTVARLNGFTLIPAMGNPANTFMNRSNLQQSTNIKAFRNAVGADIVITLVGTQTNLGTCGVAYIQSTGCGGNASGCGPAPTFSEWSYILESVQCSAIDITAHEVGHVLGAEHNMNQTSTLPPDASFPYSYGYGVPSTTTGFETAMTQEYYFTPSIYPVRLLQFSNPNLSYLGQPTGVIGSEYNALTLTNLAPITSAFRTRPNLIFANGFDQFDACSGVNF